MYEGQHHSGIWGVFWGGSSRMGCQSPDGIPKPLTSRRRGGLRAGRGGQELAGSEPSASSCTQYGGRWPEAEWRRTDGRDRVPRAYCF